MVNKKYKKISWFVFFLILLNIAYFLIPWGVLILMREFFSYPTFVTDFMGFSYLTPLIFLLQSALLFFYFFKNLSRKVIIITSSLFLFFHSVLAVIPFEYCDGNLWGRSSCDCIGIRKYQLFGTECVGIRN